MLSLLHACPSSEWRPKAASVAIGMCVPVFFYTTYRIISKLPPKKKSSDHSRGVPSTDWSCLTVCNWLASRNISMDGVFLLAQHRVDGKRLPHLNIRELLEMGLSAEDRRIVLSSLSEMSDMNEESEPVQDANVKPQKVTSSKKTDRESLPLDIFISNVGSFIMQGMLTEFPESEADALSHRAKIATNLYSLLNDFRCLDILDQKAAMWPLAQKITGFLASPIKYSSQSLHRQNSAREAFAHAPVHPPLQTPSSLHQAKPFQEAIPEDFVERIRPLHKMVDQFIELLSSEEVLNASDAEFSIAAKQMKEQVVRIFQVADALPRSLGDPLTLKCTKVLDMINARLREKRDAPQDVRAESVPKGPLGPTTLPHDANAAISVPAAITRLLEVYERVSNPAITKIEPVQRRNLIGECLAELRSIDAPLRASNDPRAIYGREMSSQIYAILERLHKVTEDENLLSQGMSAQDADTTEKAFSSVRREMEQISKVVSRLKLENISPEIKAMVEGRLRERITGLLESIASLPDAEREELRLHITPILDLLSSPTQGVFEKAEEPRRESKLTGDDDAKEKEEELKEKDEKNDAEPSELKNIVTEAMNQLKRIFLFLRSDKFVNSKPEERKALAEELLKRTNSATEVLQCIGGNESLIERIAAPIKEILMSNIENASAPEPGSETIRILTDIKSALSSPAFQQSDRNDRIRFARIFLPQVQHIESLESLPPLEHAAVEKLLKSIKHSFHEILSNAEPERPTSSPETSEPIAEEASIVFANPSDISKQLKDVMDVIQSKEFMKSAMDGHLELVASCISELKWIREQCKKLSPSIRQEFEKIVSQIQNQVDRIMQGAGSANSAAPVEEVPMPPPAANAGDAAERNSSSVRKELFDMILNITRELQQGTAKHLQLNEAELDPFWSLLEMVNKMGELSPEEGYLRDEFETALQLASQGLPLPAEKDPVVSAASASASAFIPPLEQLQRESSETDENASRETNFDYIFYAIQDVDSFIRIIGFIQSIIAKRTSPSLEELVLFKDLVQKGIEAANKHGIAWKENEEAVAAIKAVQEELNKMELFVNTQGEGSKIMSIVENALHEIEESPPTSYEMLKPYQEIYESVLPLLSSSPEGLELLNRLKACIMEIERDPNFTNDEDATTIEDRLSNALFELSYRLREPNLSKEDLDECDKILDHWSDMKIDNPDIQEAIAAVRQQVQLNRASLELDEEDAPESDTDDEVAAEEEGGDGQMREEKSEPYPTASGVAFKEDDDDSVTDAHEPCVTVKPSRLPTYDHIPGGLESELTLLPKIEACIQKPTEQFVSTCNLFDIQSISKVLLHLSSSVERYPELQGRINAVKLKFLSRLQAFEAAEAPSQDVQASHHLQITLTDTTDEDGRRAYHVLVFHADEEATEAGDAATPANLAAVASRQTPANAARTAVGEADVQGWAGRSTAVLVLGQDSPTEGTARSELVLLQEVLSRRYGFDVVCVTGPAADAAGVEGLLKDLAEGVGGEGEGRLTRLLVFYHTPRTAAGVSVPQAMTFHDDSVLEHRRVLEVTAGVERVVVVHSMPRRLEVMARLGETASPAMSVLVTPAAAREVAKVRCLLYEGLFTPILVELLCRDEGNMLCPEDLVNYAITAMTRLTIEFGSFLKNEAASMGYFVPFDN